MLRREVLTTAMAAGALGASGAEAAATPPRRRGTSPGTVAARDGTRLFVREWGEGQPMLLLHSWALDSTIWQRQFLHLGANGVRCIAFDRRGHGRSDAPAGGYDLDTLADDVAAVVEALGLRDLTLVGHSMGGGEAVRYLGRHGTSRVRNVALVSSTTPFLTRTADNPHGAPSAYHAARRAEWASDFPK
jgi:non-heme chloroperoxidase